MSAPSIRIDASSEAAYFDLGGAGRAGDDLKMFIGGAWTPALSGETLKVENPANGTILAYAAQGDTHDVELAVRAARRTFASKAWRGLSGAQRARILWRVADLIDAKREAIARVETLDNGMPLTMARGMVDLAAETFRYFAGWCTKIHGSTSEISGPQGEFHTYSLREPIGVAGLIVPWNVPFVFACNKVSVALAAGCSLVLKPAEETPLGALMLGGILAEAGVPPGVVNIVTGLGHTVGAALVAHPDVDKVGFTGSTEVGKKIVTASAGNLKKLTLELGGKSPVIVFDDADIDAAIAGAAKGVFTNSGQVCIAGSRLYVQRKIYDRVVAGVADRARNLNVGDGFDPDTDMGPLISHRQLARVTEMVESGLQDNATLVTGGASHLPAGYFFQPTVLTSPNSGARILREEIFGPVITIVPFDEAEDAVAMANDTVFGLGGSVWTQNLRLAHTVAKQLEAGNVWINCALLTHRTMPMGGYKQSGWGRENGWEGVEAYLETKSVYAAL